MSVITLIASFTALLWLASLAWPLAERLRIPVAAVQMALGCAAATAVVAAGVDTGLRHDSFHDLVVYAFLPICVFDAALALNVRNHGGVLLRALVLGAIGVIATLAIAAPLIYAGINHPVGFPMLAALLTAALLAATDPAAIVTHLRSAGAPERLVTMLEAESLLNDGLAVVVFAVFVALAQSPSPDLNTASVALDLLRVLGLGAAAGAIGGVLARLAMHGTHAAGARVLLSVAAAYTSYLGAEWLTGSGVVAVLVTGLALGSGNGRQPSLDGLWQPLGTMANGMIFVLAGVTLTWSMFAERWLAMLIAIVAVLAARAVTIYGVCAIGAAWRPLPPTDQHVLFWGGTRGGVTLALALMLPTTLDYWWTIQSIAYGVVVFNLVLQLPLAGVIIRADRARGDA